MKPGMATVEPETAMRNDSRIPPQLKTVSSSVVDQGGPAFLQRAGKSLHAAWRRTRHLQAVQPHAGERLRIGPRVAEGNRHAQPAVEAQAAHAGR